MKKYIALILAAMLMLCLAACGSESQDDDAADEAELTEDAVGSGVDGGWTVTDSSAVKLPEEVQTAFDKALEGFTGSNLTPLAYFGSQVVAGTNYAVLCRAETVTPDPDESLVVAIIYADLQGNAELTHLNDFDFDDYTEADDDDDDDDDELVGGWQIPEDYTKADLPAEASAAFEKASEGLLGNDLVPMACLGTQIVSGTNYAILCHSTLTTESPVEKIQVVTVYEDLDGNAEITNIATVDIADYNED